MLEKGLISYLRFLICDDGFDILCDFDSLCLFVNFSRCFGKTKKGARWKTIEIRLVKNLSTSMACNFETSPMSINPWIIHEQFDFGFVTKWHAM